MCHSSQRQAGKVTFGRLLIHRVPPRGSKRGPAPSSKRSVRLWARPDEGGIVAPRRTRGLLHVPARDHRGERLARSLWQQRAAIADKPIRILWGMKDIAFRPKELARWEAAFPNAEVTRFPRAGHWIAEEEPEALTDAIRAVAMGTAHAAG